MSDELTTRVEVTKRGYLQLSGLREGCSEQDGRDYLKEHRDVWYDSYALGERKKER